LTDEKLPEGNFPPRHSTFRPQVISSPCYRRGNPLGSDVFALPRMMQSAWNAETQTLHIPVNTPSGAFQRAVPRYTAHSRT